MKKTVLILSSVFALSLSATTNNVETQQVANKVVVSSTSVDNLDIIGETAKVRKKGETAKVRKKGEVTKVRKKGEVTKVRKKGEVTKVRKKGEVAKVRKKNQVL